MIVRYDLDLPPEAVRDRLRSATDRESLLYRTLPGIVAGKQLVGIVGPDAFEVHVRQQNYNSLAPRARGSIERTERGSVVTVELGAPPTTVNGLAVLIGATGLGGGLVLVGAGYPLGVGVFVALCLLVVSWFVRSSGPGSGFPRKEQLELHEALDAIFGANAQGTEDGTRGRGVGGPSTA